MTIRVWSVATSQSVAGPFVGHTDQVHCVAYSSDGTHIVSGSWDKTIRVWSMWNAITTQCVAGPFQSHTNLVTSVAFSPDGGQIITGSADCSIKVWSVHKFASLDDFHEENGWIWSSNVGYLGWLAPWNRNAFQLPIQSLVISPYSTYQVETSDSPFLGESWTSCLALTLPFAFDSHVTPILSSCFYRIEQRKECNLYFDQVISCSLTSWIDQCTNRGSGLDKNICSSQWICKSTMEGQRAHGPHVW